jgi:CubicO group peptidase (beta-lactamase class C family)
LSSEVAGRLIEVVSRQPLNQYLASCIFEPGGMKSTYFFVPVQEHSRLVIPHVREGGTVVPAP